MSSDGSYSFETTDPAYAALAVNDVQVVLAIYTVTDEFGVEGHATLTINVTGTNDAQGAHDDTGSVSEDGPGIIIDLLDNDTDVDLADLLSCAGSMIASRELRNRSSDGA